MASGSKAPDRSLTLFETASLRVAMKTSTNPTDSSAAPNVQNPNVVLRREFQKLHVLKEASRRSQLASQNEQPADSNEIMKLKAALTEWEVKDVASAEDAARKVIQLEASEALLAVMTEAKAMQISVSKANFAQTVKELQEAVEQENVRLIERQSKAMMDELVLKEQNARKEMQLDEFALFLSILIEKNHLNPVAIPPTTKANVSDANVQTDEEDRSQEKEMGLAIEKMKASLNDSEIEKLILSENGERQAIVTEELDAFWTQRLSLSSALESSWLRSVEKLSLELAGLRDANGMLTKREEEWKKNQEATIISLESSDRALLTSEETAERHSIWQSGVRIALGLTRPGWADDGMFGLKGMNPKGLGSTLENMGSLMNACSTSVLLPLHTLHQLSAEFCAKEHESFVWKNFCDVLLDRLAETQRYARTLVTTLNRPKWLPAFHGFVASRFSALDTFWTAYTTSISDSFMALCETSVNRANLWNQMGKLGLLEKGCQTEGRRLEIRDEEVLGLMRTMSPSRQVYLGGLSEVFDESHEGNDSLISPSTVQVLPFNEALVVSNKHLRKTLQASEQEKIALYTSLNKFAACAYDVKKQQVLPRIEDKNDKTSESSSKDLLSLTEAQRILAIVKQVDASMADHHRWLLDVFQTPRKNPTMRHREDARRFSKAYRLTSARPMGNVPSSALQIAKGLLQRLEEIASLTASMRTSARDANSEASVQLTHPIMGSTHSSVTTMPSARRRTLSPLPSSTIHSTSSPPYSPMSLTEQPSRLNQGSAE